MAQNSVLPEQQTSLKSWRAVAALIDHTLLRPDATKDQITRLCEEALHYGFCTAMVNPCHVAHASAVLHGSQVKVGTVVGFPLGASLTPVKLFEAVQAMKLGAGELDMVLNIGALKAGDKAQVETEIHALARVAHDGGTVLKVILETALLDEKEKILACSLAARASADFVKTSTGFGSHGATVKDIVLMRGVVGHALGVKAAGGIRTAADVEAMLDAGANRIGASTSVAIVREMGAPG